MNKLKELIAELCPNGVEFCSLERCCNLLDRKRKPVTKSAREAVLRAEIDKIIREIEE